MADDLSFTISAQDQASKAVETVQKKIQGFGADVAKLALGVVGPMALLQAGIGYVTTKWTEYKQAQKDAFENGAKPVYEELKAQQELGLQLDKNLSVLLATAKIKQEQAKNAEDIRAQEDQAIKAFYETENGKRFKDVNTASESGLMMASREKILRAARLEGERQDVKNNEKKYGPNSTPQSRAEKDRKDAQEAQATKDLPELNKVNEKIKEAQQNLAQGGALTGEDLVNQLSKQVSLAQRQYDIINEGLSSQLQKENALLKLELAKIALRDEQTKQSKEQAEALAKQVKDEEAKLAKEADALAKKSITKDDKKDMPTLTVSSLREIGGSFGGGDVSTGIERQVELAQKQVDVLTTIASNTSPKEPTGKPIMVGDTNFTLPGGKTITAAELLGF